MNFSSEKEVEEHRLSHQKVNQFECPKCDWSFVSLDNLKSHLEKRHKDESADNECSICGRSVRNTNELEEHVRKYHLSSKRKY